MSYSMLKQWPIGKIIAYLHVNNISRSSSNYRLNLNIWKTKFIHYKISYILFIMKKQKPNLDLDIIKKNIMTTQINMIIKIIKIIKMRGNISEESILIKVSEISIFHSLKIGKNRDN
jgi:hypothetical protein